MSRLRVCKNAEVVRWLGGNADQRVDRPDGYHSSVIVHPTAIVLARCGESRLDRLLKAALSYQRCRCGTDLGDRGRGQFCNLGVDGLVGGCVTVDERA